MKRLFGMAAGLAFVAVAASAQNPSADKMKTELRTLLERSRVVGTVGGVMGKVVKNAPYSGQEVSENTQVLADGTRLHNESRVNVFRDNDGRVRREEGDHVTIWDPVTSTSYTLDTKNMTVAKFNMPSPVFVRRFDGAGAGTGIGIGGGIAIAAPAGVPAHAPVGNVSVKDGMVTVTQDGQTRTFPMPPSGEWTSEDGKLHAMFRKTGEGPEAGNHVFVQEDHVMLTNDGPATAVALSKGEAEAMDKVMMASGPDAVKLAKVTLDASQAGKVEDLGEQMVEGVKAVGTRRTVTLAVGAIGNDRPINTVTERWYSNELQTDVMTKRTDPRMGESTFHLTNVDRSEPAAYLFQVPSGYTSLDRK